MDSFVTRADLVAIEAEMPWPDRGMPVTIHRFLGAARALHGTRPAVTFQLLSGPQTKARTLTWNTLYAQVTQTANLLRGLGIGPTDVVAYVLPNTLETAVTLLGGMVAGIVSPINPLLEADQISAILRETGAKVVVTLTAFPKTDIAQKVAEAVRHAPQVRHVLEVDLAGYLAPPKSWLARLARPKVQVSHTARVMAFDRAIAAHSGDRLTFADPSQDRIAAYFHTGGTTGMPKVVQHKVSSMVYNGWLGHRLLFRETDTVICPLPMFHVFACYPVLMSMIASGAHVVFPTPAGYRGEGVFDNLWKLIARWQVSYLITVPTALAALLQRPVNADISSLRGCISGSAALPVEVFRRFEALTGIQVIEGYGLTECTSLVAVNPPGGSKRIGSVGFPFPYCDLRVLTSDGAGGWRDCEVDEVGEICVSSPGVYPGHTYTEADKNRDLFIGDKYLRTGDLGRIDPEGYVYITGRAKDLIIRGGHNIDPQVIEEALMGHPAVALVGAIGQPDAHAGELPAAYVELVRDQKVSVADLMSFARDKIHERAAVPKHIEIVPELPKTAVGKVFKPDLRRSAITRVYGAALSEAGLPVTVSDVIEDKKRGLVARLARKGAVDEAAVGKVLDAFTRPWEWAD